MWAPSATAWLHSRFLAGTTAAQGLGPQQLWGSKELVCHNPQTPCGFSKLHGDCCWSSSGKVLIKETKQLCCLHHACPSPEGGRGCWGSQSPIPWLPALCLCSDNWYGPSQLDSLSIAAFLAAPQMAEEALCFPWEYSPVAQESSASTVLSTAAV